MAGLAGSVAAQGAELADPQELLRWVHGVQPKSRLDAYPLFIMVRAGTHCTGLVQIAGQVQACGRDSPSKHWAKSRNLGQPCENHLAGAGRRGARTRVTHNKSCIAVHRLQRACAACRLLIAIIVLGAAPGSRPAGARAGERGGAGHAPARAAGAEDGSHARAPFDGDHRVRSHIVALHRRSST